VIPSTCQTGGVADLLMFLPRPPMGALFIKQKRSGGTLSPAQEVFRACCLSSRIAHLVGKRDDVIAWLMQYGYVR
jgi:hypothetical protein